MLFLHGTGTYSATFEPVTGKLPEGIRAITYDRRGFGASGDVLAGSLGVHVEDAAALLEALGASPAVVCGSSAGGLLALRLALARPDLVSALILVEPAYQMALTPSPTASATLGAVYLQRWLGRDPEGAALRFYRWATGYSWGGNQYDSYPEEWRRTAAGHTAAVLRELSQLILPHPRRSAVRGLSVPTSVIIGDAGRPVFQRTARLVLRLVPGAKEVAAPGAAHLVYTDQPEICAQAIADVLAREGARAREGVRPHGV